MRTWWRFRCRASADRCAEAPPSESLRPVPDEAAYPVEVRGLTSEPTSRPSERCAARPDFRRAGLLTTVKAHGARSSGNCRLDILIGVSFEEKGGLPPASAVEKHLEERKFLSGPQPRGFELRLALDIFFQFVRGF